MKKIILIIVGVILAAIVITAVAFFIPKQNGCFNLASVNGYFQVKNYLEKIRDEAYQKAFEQVYYYDETPEKGAVLPYEEAMEIWSKRVSAAKNDIYPEYLSGFDNLNVYMQDGTLTATVRIAVSIRGVEKEYETHIYFYNGKIAGISTETILTDYEKAVSGKIN